MNAGAEIRLAMAADEAVIARMMEPYLRELAPYGAEPGDYPWLGTYWTEERRWPWLIGGLPPAGFALVNTETMIDRPVEYAMAEFYIRPDARRAGVGLAAARALFRHHAGQWEVAVLAGNTPALAFWDAALDHPRIRAHERLTRDPSVIHRFVSEDASR